jgi:hypothetical protein
LLAASRNSLNRRRSLNSGRMLPRMRTARFSKSRRFLRNYSAKQALRTSCWRVRRAACEDSGVLLPVFPPEAARGAWRRLPLPSAMHISATRTFWCSPRRFSIARNRSSSLPRASCAVGRVCRLRWREPGLPRKLPGQDWPRWQGGVDGGAKVTSYDESVRQNREKTDSAG